MINKVRMRRNILERAIEKVKVNPEIIIPHIMFGIYSFVVSHISLHGGISPFGIAVTTSSPIQFSVTAFIFSSLGYALGQPVIYAVRYILLSALLKIFFTVTERKTMYTEIWFLPPLAVLAFSFTSGFVLNLITGMSIDKISWTFSESVIGAISTYFMSKCVNLKNELTKADLRSKDIVCILYTFGVFVLSFSSFEVFNISFADILSGILILLFACYGNETSGCIIGITSGVSTSIGTSSGYDMLASSLCGLTTGAFAPLGKAGCILSYLLTKIAVFILSGTKGNFIPMIIQSAISILIFTALPVKLTNSITKLFTISQPETDKINVGKIVSQKLNGASSCLNEISETMDKISESLKKISDSSVKGVYCRVQNQICKKCRRYDACWERNFNATYNLFEETAEIFDDKENVSKEDLPKRFLNMCISPDDFLSSFEKNYRRSKILHEEELKTENMRNVFYDQLTCMSSALDNFSKNILKEDSFDTETAFKIKCIMRNLKINAQSVKCIVDPNGTMTIESICKSIDENLDKSKLISEIEKITLRKFERPEIQFSENGIYIKIIQRPWMTIDIGTMQYPSRNSTICGDYCENYYENGKETMVISDGMGTGGRAAIDSALTAEFFSKLLRSGFNENCALKIVNSAMLVKSSYESLSTIDEAKIDLFTGKVDFYKAGASTSFVRKNGKCTTVEGSSLPIGILREIEFSHEKITVSPGDIIVMVSDGVTLCGTEWIKEEIEKYFGDNPQKLAQKIAVRANEKIPDNQTDDLTVLVGIIG